MSQITAADVAKLRKMTGAGMMDCKNALTEANGDFEKAMETIRKKGQAVAMKRADREATEGCALAGVSDDKKTAIIVAVSCETDFVAKNADFVAFTNSILNVAIENKPNNIDELKALTIDGAKIQDLLMDKLATIGEKIDLTYFEVINAEDVIAYTHNGNKIATIVGFSHKLTDEQIGKDIAMQITAMNPVSILKDDVPQSVIDKEIEIGKEQARQEGKPENMIEKIALGKLNKFFKESTLMNQEFIKDSKITVAQYLEQSNKDLKVTAFKRCSLVL